MAGLLLVPMLASAAPPSKPELEREKLRQEIQQLKLSNRDHQGLRGLLGTYGGLIAGLAALGTVLVALTNLVHQRNLDRQQREAENTRRLDEQFTRILADLGDESEAVQAAAAVSLLTFLRPEHMEYQRQVRLVALANLKVRTPGPVTALLVRTFADALRTQEPIQSDEINFAAAELRGINLAGLDLREAVLREANLRDADLTGANLRSVDAHKAQLQGACLSGTDLRESHLERAEATKAVFHDEANLASAKFDDADLRGARFEGASLQSAHFDRADLEGARFQSADINDAFFRTSKFDAATIRGLDRAKNKGKAHFSEEIAAALQGAKPASAQENATPP
jgi:uncharacterized protein YjbI with pentapeptide repeats